MADITMPQLGETVTEGTITKWLKQVGDRIEEDEVIYEVSTDKVDSEVPSPVSGFLSEIRVAEGETAEVGAVLAVVADEPPGEGGGGGERAEGAEAEAEKAPRSDDDGGDAGARPAAEAEPGEDEGGGGEEAGRSEEAEDEAAASAGGDGDGDDAGAGDEGDDGRQDAAASGNGSAGRRDGQEEAAPRTSGNGALSAPAREGGGQARDWAEPTSSDGGSGGRSSGAGAILSPVVRRLVAEHGLDPAEIPGTGAGGRITRGDVLAFIDKGAAARNDGGAPAEAPAAEPAQAPARARSAAPAEAVRAGEDDEVVPFSNIRRRTAEHMVRSLGTSAHTLVVIEVDYDNVDKVRNAQKEAFKQKEGVSLTYMPFIARATVDAIGSFPHVNASVGNDELIVHKRVNLGIAVDMDFQGLIVPVVTDADGKRLRALAREMGDLGRRAKAKKLSADEISGGTFTITNAGGYGTLITGPIINQPQVAILSTDGVKPKPVAVPLAGGGYGIAVHPVGNLAIAFDHRAYDGAYAAAFLARIKEILETRDWAAELS
ncbi:MAG TPA: dihydrolipoamide acetyltransferase family protein [Acidimicrobiales bacterium]|nr:dihydrolipoamide acetyltransferase family protein [Acidimicrobiales bacterium]